MFTSTKKSTNVVRTSIVFQLYFNLFYIAMSSVRSKQRAKTLHSMWFQILGAESYSIPGLMMCNSIQRVGQNEIGIFFVENWIFFLSPENATIFPLFLTNIKKFQRTSILFLTKIPWSLSFAFVVVVAVVFSFHQHLCVPSRIEMLVSPKTAKKKHVNISITWQANDSKYFTGILFSVLPASNRFGCCICQQRHSSDSWNNDEKTFAPRNHE